MNIDKEEQMDKYTKAVLTVFAVCFLVGCGSQIIQARYANTGDYTLCLHAYGDYGQMYPNTIYKEIKSRNLDCSQYADRISRQLGIERALIQGMTGAAIGYGVGKSLSGSATPNAVTPALTIPSTNSQARLVRQHNNGVNKICTYCCQDGYNFTVTYRANQVCPATQ
jgi:hypothetical protein